MIDENIIRKVSQLARIELDDAECDSYTQQLGEILDYFNTLTELDTSSIEPAVHAV